MCQRYVGHLGLRFTQFVWKALYQEACVQPFGCCICFSASSGSVERSRGLCATLVAAYTSLIPSGKRPVRDFWLHPLLHSTSSDLGRCCICSTITLLLHIILLRTICQSFFSRNTTSYSPSPTRHSSCCTLPYVGCHSSVFQSYFKFHRCDFVQITWVCIYTTIFAVHSWWTFPAGRIVAILQIL